MFGSIAPGDTQAVTLQEMMTKIERARLLFTIQLADSYRECVCAVSYTHLTLPTTAEV